MTTLPIINAGNTALANRCKIGADTVIFTGIVVGCDDIFSPIRRLMEKIVILPVFWSKKMPPSARILSP